MTTPEQPTIPELPTEKGLDNALRQLHGDFYMRHIELTTHQWLMSQAETYKSRYEVILFHADGLGAMLAHKHGEAELDDEHAHNAEFVAAREGILAGLMVGEQWLSRDMDVAEVLKKMIATGVTLWERRPEYRPHITAALLERAVEGLDLLTPAQLRKAKVWEKDVAKDNDTPQSDMFSLGLGLGLIESKHHFDYWRGSLVLSEEERHMGDPQSILDLDYLNGQFSERSSTGDEAISD